MLTEAFGGWNKLFCTGNTISSGRHIEPFCGHTITVNILEVSITSLMSLLLGILTKAIGHSWLGMENPLDWDAACSWKL